MLPTSKIKWLASIALAAILLTLALMGGKWGTSYSANAGVYVAPVINVIHPNWAPAGSPDKMVIITGSNFGNVPDDVRIRVTGTLTDCLITPLQVIDSGISFIITDTLLIEPAVYSLMVMKSTIGTVPILPIPPNMEISNAVDFYVFVPISVYLPLATKNAVH